MPLPKEFFTLPEVAERWKCDDGAFLSYALQDTLTYSVYLRDLGSHKTVEENEEERITRFPQRCLLDDKPETTSGIPSLYSRPTTPGESLKREEMSR